MNSVTKKLRSDLIASIQATLEVSQQIQGLKWKDGSLPEVQKLRSVKNEQGHKIHGKRALKPYRRPETGPERYLLWYKKRGLGSTTREYLLLYAMLRGKAYDRAEKKCREGNEPSVYCMAQALERYFEGGKCPITMNHISEWIAGGAAPSLEEAA